MNAMIATYLEPFDLPQSAQHLIASLWQAIQGLDDWVDGDDCPRGEKDAAIWACLVGIPSNGFFRANSDTLLPVIASMVLKWKASDTVERTEMKELFPKAFVWRAGFYEVILQIVLLVHGPQKTMDMAPSVLSMYAEQYEDYLKEFDHA